MPNRSEAYDFSLFESHLDHTAPVREPRREEQNTRQNVVQLPEKELKKNAKPKLHPVRSMAAVMAFTAFFVLAVAMVYSQQQLTVLTEKINAATEDLAEAESLEVQLNMQAAQKMNGSQVEEYAVNELGMSKITSQQVTYVNVAQQDKGTVVRDTDGGSIVDQILATIRSWFA